MSPGREANKIDNDRIFMRSAIELAKRSADEGEVVRNGKSVATGRNRRENDKNATVHAELQAIDRACSVLGGWRLWECELYVTMEPCPMCAGAIINSRIKRVVFGAYDQKAGSCGSVINLFDLPYNHKPELVGGFMRDECSAVLSGFFKDLREKKKG